MEEQTDQLRKRRPDEALIQLLANVWGFLMGLWVGVFWVFFYSPEEFSVFPLLWVIKRCGASHRRSRHGGQG